MPSVNLQLNWTPGCGMPPTILGPDAQRVFVYYRDKRQPSMDFDVGGGDDSTNVSVPWAGKWQFFIKSKNGSNYSAGSATDSYIVDGELSDPGNNTDPLPAGQANIAPPEGLLVTLGA